MGVAVVRGVVLGAVNGAGASSRRAAGARVAASMVVVSSPDRALNALVPTTVVTAIASETVGGLVSSAMAWSGAPPCAMSKAMSPVPIAPPALNECCKEMCFFRNGRSPLPPFLVRHQTATMAIQPKSFESVALGCHIHGRLQADAKQLRRSIRYERSFVEQGRSERIGAEHLELFPRHCHVAHHTPAQTSSGTWPPDLDHFGAQ